MSPAAPAGETMRRALQVILLLAVGSVLPGCASFAIAAGLVTVSTIHQEIKKHQYAQKLEQQRQEKLRVEAEERARIEQQRLARIQAEQRRRQQLLDERRRQEQERLERERLAALPGEAGRRSTDLAEVRRELGQIAEQAADTRKRLLQARIAGPGSPSATKENNNGNQ